MASIRKRNEGFKASDFNKIVYFLENKIVINDSGFKEEVETILKTTRALVENTSFKELYRVDKLDILNTKTIITRYNSDLLNMNLKVKYNHQDYVIKHIENLNESNRFLIFTCEKIGV